MKIVIDARTGMGTGIGRYTLNLVNKLQELDHENSYIVLLQHKDYEEWKPSTPNFTKHLADFPIYSWQEQVFLPLTLNKLKPDLVHFTSYNLPLFYFGRFVVTVHDLTLVHFKNIRGGLQRVLYPIKYWAGRLALWRALAGAKRVFVPTEFVGRGLPKRVQNKVTVTLEAADKLDVNPEPLTRFALGKGPLILYVGNAYPHKNLPRLLEAFDLMHRDHPTSQLLIGGQVDFFYQQLVERAGAGVILPGRPTDGELVSLYQKADLFVFPSLSEGFGLPPLEAMSYGTPVVASNASCIPEICGDAAVYFDPYDPRDIAEKMSVILDNKEMRDRLHKAGPDRAKLFSWKRMAEETLDIYNKVLNK